MVPLVFQDITFGPITLGIHSMMFFLAFLLLGLASVSYGFLTRLYARNTGYIPDTRMPAVLERFSLE